MGRTPKLRFVLSILIYGIFPVLPRLPGTVFVRFSADVERDHDLEFGLLFVTQRDHRINSGGAAGGDVAREEGDTGQKQPD